jgi:hypothetical protein
VPAELNVHMPCPPCNESRKPSSNTCRCPADWSRQLSPAPAQCGVALLAATFLYASHIKSLAPSRLLIACAGLTAVQRVLADSCLTNERPLFQKAAKATNAAWRFLASDGLLYQRGSKAHGCGASPVNTSGCPSGEVRERVVSQMRSVVTLFGCW